MMIPKETVLTGAAHPHTKLEVMNATGNASSYYLGFRDADGSPYSRETVYMSEASAHSMLAMIRGT